jgi:hypothetical protein
MEIFEAVVAPRIMLSDRVIREEGTRKISLIGCFDAFLSEAFPFQTGPFFATVAITNIVGFKDQADVVLRLESSAGHVFASSQAKITKRPEAPAIPRNAIVEIIFPFGPVRIESPGIFDLVCLVSNEVLARRQFEVRSTTAGPEQGE